MKLFYELDGAQQEFPLGDQPVTIGRGAEADLVLNDQGLSRAHCVITPEDGGFAIRDLESKNGTYVNGNKVTVSPLNPGDRIRVGSMVFTIDEKRPMGAQTAIHEIGKEMDGGKGYNTLLKEIVDDTEKPDTPASS